MATQYGKILRKIRIDQDELLKDMANKLEVSSAFLSSIENGRKAPPANFTARIKELYSLTSEIYYDLIRAEREYDFHQKQIIDLSTYDMEGREAIVSMARHFDSLDADQIEEIRKIISRSEGK
ncbi:MAG: XRE family transcriptional regulator [Saccharofermentanales bacterium]|jgi:transcriptional regulator with XRE-family HTH domain|nr:helix-turn-helix transcriptional regulator [Bacillota bacterium]NLB08199.1 helix-turn-helix transcriptional regulator [Clostridiales bacterium]